MTTSPTSWIDVWPTAIGPLGGVVDAAGRLREIRFHPEPIALDEALERLEQDVPDARIDPKALEIVRREVDEYLGGRRRVFELRLRPVGTDFQRRVWSALLGIPYGETRSYGEIAREIGRPRACRAVGAANGANPLPIVLPCHRVVGADGSLTGFGGGLEIKSALLELERAAVRPGLFDPPGR